MAGVILAEDIAGICLVLAGGDAGADLEQVMLEADRFQEANNRHFGAGRADLRRLFQSLFLWEMESRHPLRRRLGDRWMEGAFDGVRLFEILPIVLEYHDASLGEADQVWSGPGGGAGCGSRESYAAERLEDRLGCTWEQYSAKVKIKQALRRTFRGRQCPARASVVELMEAHGIDDRLLYDCSKRGRAS